MQAPTPGIQPVPNVAPPAPQGFFGSLHFLGWRAVIQAILLIVTIATIILWLATFGFTIPYTIFSSQSADRGNILASQANAMSNIGLAYSDRAFCVRMKAEHSPGCRDAERYILDHLRLADQFGLGLPERSDAGGSDEQITYSFIEATEFVRKSSYWMQCQLISFQEFKRDFRKLVRQIETEAPTEDEYSKDFVLQADLVIEQFGHIVDKLKSYHDSGSSQEMIDPSSLVQIALETMNTTISFRSMLISQAYQSATAATEDILKQQRECDSEPDCSIDSFDSLLMTVSKSALNATSEALFIDYRRNLCPEPCRIGLWKASFLLQKWTDKTWHLLDRQPHPVQSSIAPPRRHQTWKSILEGPKIKLALFFGIAISFMACNSFLEWILISLLYIPAFLVLQRCILTSDPIEARGRRFSNTITDVLVPGVVTWAVAMTRYNSHMRRVHMQLASVVTVVCGALAVVSVWPPVILFGPLAHRSEPPALRFGAVGALKLASAFPVSYIIIFEIPLLVEHAQRSLLNRCPVQSKFLIIFTLILGMISLYVSWMSLLLVVSVLYYVVLQIPCVSKRVWWVFNVAYFALFVVGFNMVYQEIVLYTVAFHGGCSVGEWYMEEYDDVVTMLGLPGYRGISATAGRSK